MNKEDIEETLSGAEATKEIDFVLIYIASAFGVLGIDACSGILLHGVYFYY